MLNLLIVDDEPINMLFLEGLLEDKYIIRTANNGMKAYRMIEAQIPDIILLDIIMPDIDGISILKNIKQNKQLENIIVIMVTAKIDKESIQEALLFGADDYIKKPVDATELYTKLHLHSKMRKLSKEVLDYKVFASISESMISAQRIQSAVLPDESDFERLFPSSFIIYQPRDMVGGDMYFTAQNKNKTFLCVADSTGHGVPAAMLSMLSFMALNYIVNRLKISDPTAVATLLTRELAYVLTRSTDTHVLSLNLDAVFCEFDCENDILTFSSIKRPIVIVRHKKNYLMLNGRKVKPLISKDEYHLFYIRGDFNINGICKEKNGFAKKNIAELMPEDMIYMYSDGATDQFGGPKDKKFSNKRFLKLLLSCQRSMLRFQKLQIYQALEQWSVAVEQTDDIVIIGIKYKTTLSSISN